MTAVATFISKEGVAIAADSASTITAGGNIQKVYNSATKIFHLSENIPIAAVIWGDAGHKGVPWGILLREFGQSIKKPYREFYDYPEAFLGFLKKHKQFFKSGHKADSFRDELLSVYQGIVDNVHEELRAAKADKKEVLGQVIAYSKDYYDKMIPYTYEELNDIIKNPAFRSTAEGCVTAAFKGLKLSVDEQFALGHIAALKYSETERNDSGIFMAGYGSKDIFPSQAIISDGVFNKKFLINEYLSIDNEKSPGILRLLAQHGPANTFMEGIDDGIRHFVGKQLEEMFEEMVALGSSGLDAKQRNKFIKAAEKILVEKHGNIEGFIASQYSDGMKANLEFMPLNDMAQLVETLVKLTAYHARLSETHETVGGPIDVAVINRDKAFSWIKSK